MGLFFSFILITICLLLSLPLPLYAARGKLAVGESIYVNETLISAGGIFALGFFSPVNSTRDLYAAIWYNQIPGKTVVWVANREQPLTDAAGFLTVKEDGNIAVLDGKGSTLWSTSLSSVPRNTSATLLDSGNLVLGHGEDDALWQSFEHPTDTLLPEMKIRINISGVPSPKFISWRSATDPSPGEFVYTFDPKTQLQFYIMKGSEIYRRLDVWNGLPSFSPTTVNYTSPTYNYFETVEQDHVGLYLVFRIRDGTPVRSVLDHTGEMIFYLWDKNTPEWKRISSTSPCDVYNRCGSSGYCDATGNSPLSPCKCPEGFEPKNTEQWNVGNFTAGCTRQVKLSCDGTDRFVKFQSMKLPDLFSVTWNISRTQCEMRCSGTCACHAYAFANFTISNLTYSRCLMWEGELIDLVQVPELSEDLYVLLSSKPRYDNHTEHLSSSPKNKALIPVILPTVLGAMLLIGLFIYFTIKCLRYHACKRDARKLWRLEELDFSIIPTSEKDITDVPLLDFRTVKAATCNFSIGNKLGEGGFGAVYKGELLSGREIAVKRLSKGSNQGYEEFANEVRLIGRLQHKNLVRLLGWCSHKDEKILVYEYMPNKSLDTFIFDPTKSVELDWIRRYKIIEGIANGLLYLHQYSRMRVIHRDMKTSNILLDKEMNPKISDFGLARILEINETAVNTRRVVGTCGYMSPEYAIDGVFSEKSDVYSFGVILIEIVTGKRSTGFYHHEISQNLLGYAWQMWKEDRVLQLLDPSICCSVQHSQVQRCIQLGLLCIQEDPVDRPTMCSVVSSLSNETCTLPVPKQPAFAYGRVLSPSLLAHEGETSVNQLTISSLQAR